MVQRPDSGFGVERATLGKGPAGAQASPGSGGEGETDAGAARAVPWWPAARCLRRALAAAPR